MKISNEIKAGLVVVMGILLMVFFFAKTATVGTGTYELKTYFTYAGNLKTDAVVKLSGIEVGRLKRIKFVYDPETKVECLLDVHKSARIRTDSIAYVDTAGFVGDAYIGITPGVSTEFAKPKTVIPSEDPIQMRLLMKKADEIAGSLDTILTDVKEIVSDNKQNLNNIIVNLEGTTKNFEEFSADIKKHPWKLLFKGE